MVTTAISQYWLAAPQWHIENEQWSDSWPNIPFLAAVNHNNDNEWHVAIVYKFIGDDNLYLDAAGDHQWSFTCHDINYVAAISNIETIKINDYETTNTNDVQHRVGIMILMAIAILIIKVLLSLSLDP